MSINDRFKTQLIKAGLIYIIIILSEFHSCSAQSLKRFVNNYQVGLEASFGIKSFLLSSDIAPIDQLNVVEEGGLISVVIGAKAFRLKVGQGYYYSSSTVAHTVDEIKTAGILNFYPLQLFAKSTSAFRPYFTGSIERSVLKMYGFYASGNESNTRNYSVSEAPYLGKIAALQASLGAGIEYRIEKPGHFVNFFGEAKYSRPVSSHSNSAFFNKTTTSNQFAVSVGIGFGYNR